MTFDSMVLLLEYREMENDTCDMCELFERGYHFQSAFEYSPKRDANRIIGIDLHDVSVKPYILRLLVSQPILWPVVCNHDRLDMSRGSFNKTHVFKVAL